MLEFLTSEGVGPCGVVIGEYYLFQTIKIFFDLVCVLADGQTILKNRFQFLQLSNPTFFLHGGQARRIRDH